jgi:hypothetical protein
MSSERRGVELLLDSICAFRSALLRVMVAVRLRWLQRVRGDELGGHRLASVHLQRSEGKRADGPVLGGMDEFNFAGQRRTVTAEEYSMKTNELQTILGYLNIGLAIAHNAGVSGGHFGNTDFIQLAEMVNSLFLRAITPGASMVPSVAAPAVTAAPIVINAPAAASVAVAH